MWVGTERTYVDLGLQAAVAATHGPEARLPAVDIHSTQTLPAQEMDGKVLSEFYLRRVELRLHDVHTYALVS